MPWWAVFIPLYITLIYIGVIIVWIAGYDTFLEDEQRFDRIVPGNVLLMALML